MNCLGGYDVILVKQVWRSPGSRACNLPGKWKFLCAIHFHTVWTDEINRAKTVLLISSAEYSSNYLYSKNRYRYPNIWKPVVQNKICPNLFTILILWFYETSWNVRKPSRTEPSPKNLKKKKKPTFPCRLLSSVSRGKACSNLNRGSSLVDAAGRRNAVTVPEFRSDFHLRRPSKADNDPDAWSVQLTFLPSRYRVDKRVVVRGSVGLRYPVELVTERNTCSLRSLTNRSTFFPQGDWPRSPKIFEKNFWKFREEMGRRLKRIR